MFSLRKKSAPASVEAEVGDVYGLDPARHAAKQAMEESLARNRAEREEAPLALAAARDMHAAALAARQEAIAAVQRVDAEISEQHQKVDIEIVAAEAALQRAADAGDESGEQQSAASLQTLKARKAQIDRGALMAQKAARQQTVDRRQKELDAAVDEVAAAQDRVLKADRQAEMNQADILQHELAESAARFIRLGRPGKRPSEGIHVPALHFYNAKHCFLALPRELERGGKLELSSFMVSVRLNADAPVSQAPAAGAA